jgi:hypothetical protein
MTILLEKTDGSFSIKEIEHVSFTPDWMSLVLYGGKTESIDLREIVSIRLKVN